MYDIHSYSMYRFLQLILVLVDLVWGFSQSQDLHWKWATCGGHPTKPQKKQFFNLTVVGKLSCFRELHFFPPKPLKIKFLLHWKWATCGGHPMKPQKKQFFNLTVVGKLSCFRELHFFSQTVWNLAFNSRCVPSRNLGDFYRLQGFGTKIILRQRARALAE